MSSTNGKNVNANELYPTPKKNVDTLLDVVQLRPLDRFLEPCKGFGVIYDAITLPPMQKSYAELTEGIDYLTTEFGEQDVIITNPPFSLTAEFLAKSFRELAPDGTLIYLQRVNWLGTLVRYPFWGHYGVPNKTPVIVPRPSFSKGGSDSCEYMWMIWDFGNRVNLPTGLSHLLTKGHEDSRDIQKGKDKLAGLLEWNT